MSRGVMARVRALVVVQGMVLLVTGVYRCLLVPCDMRTLPRWCNDNTFGFNRWALVLASPSKRHCLQVVQVVLLLITGLLLPYDIHTRDEDSWCNNNTTTTFIFYRCGTGISFTTQEEEETPYNTHHRPLYSRSKAQNKVTLNCRQPQYSPAHTHKHTHTHTATGEVR